ncbi:MAG: hypothetical protein JRI43_08530, partial [Deltaproteobacteria bacterium]|nr:hypothetical protein [Deltaproteobacteria bacterium]
MAIRTLFYVTAGVVITVYCHTAGRTPLKMQGPIAVFLLSKGDLVVRPPDACHGMPYPIPAQTANFH